MVGEDPHSSVRYLESSTALLNHLALLTPENAGGGSRIAGIWRSCCAHGSRGMKTDTEIFYAGLNTITLRLSVIIFPWTQIN